MMITNFEYSYDQIAGICEVSTPDRVYLIDRRVIEQFKYILQAERGQHLTLQQLIPLLIEQYGDELEYYDRDL